MSARMADELQNRFLKSDPGRLVLLQDVVLRVELDELGIGYEGRDEPSFRERRDVVFASVLTSVRILSAAA